MADSSEGEHYRRLLEQSPAGVMFTTFEGEIVSANESAAEALGFDSPEGLVGDRIQNYYSDLDDRDRLLRELERDGEIRHRELTMTTKSGDPAHFLISVRRDRHPEYGDELLLTTAVEITEQHQFRERLEHLARHDDLTGLLDRRALFDRAEQVLSMCEREGRRAAVLYLDIAGFKKVNEQLGHQGGDEILAAVGDRLDATTRDADLAARIGGDEFVVLATLLRDEDDAEQVGRRIMYAFEEPFEGAGIPLQLQPAIGIAVYPEDGTEMDTLLRRADRALWGPDRKKTAGIRRYHPGVEGTETTPGWNVTGELERALQRGDELFQVYQPIVSARDGDVVGLESLVRWEHPEHGLLEPGTFIPEAEASGLIRQVDRVVFRDSVAQAAAWIEEDLPFGWLSVNLSAQSLSDPSCVDWARRTLEKHPSVDPARIVVEITEHTAMRQVSRTNILDRLQDDVGLSISIDDFGIGYSSLLYLRQFPADFLKIDMEFVHEVTESEANQKVVRGIIALGDAFDMDLIAEGVETEAQANWLREAGCHFLQGYLFGRPAEARDVAAMLG